MEIFATDGSQPLIRDRDGMLMRHIVACRLLVVLSLETNLGQAAEIDMAEVRRLTKEPVQTILQGSAFANISDADYKAKVQGSSRPVIVLFYADRDEKSRDLATLARYIALEF